MVPLYQGFGMLAPVLTLFCRTTPIRNGHAKSQCCSSFPSLKETRSSCFQEMAYSFWWLCFKDIQHKLQANLDVSVSVTSEKSTPRTAEATTAEPGPRCSSSGPFRRVGNNKESITSRMGPGSWHTAVRDTARSTGTAGWKTRGTGRSKGKICGYERSLCPGQEVPYYSHFHLCLSTRLSSPGVWNEQRKA